MSALDWAIQSREGLQWSCTNRETAEAAQRQAPHMAVLCRTPGGVWREATAADLGPGATEADRLRARVAELEAARHATRTAALIALAKAMREEPSYELENLLDSLGEAVIGDSLAGEVDRLVGEIVSLAFMDEVAGGGS